MKSYNLWRYMDFTKLERLLKDKSIYFCSARNFDDKFEAEYAWGPTGHQKYLENIKKLNEKFGGGMDIQSFMATHLKDIKDLATRSYVSCWNKNTNESEAMWKLYCSEYGSHGVVIKTDVQKLKACLMNIDKNILFKNVQYVANFFVKKYNPEIEEMLCHKRKAFEFENEYRAFFVDRDELFNVNPKEGYSMQINPEELISEIRVSPYAAEHMKNEVVKLVRRYNMNINVKSSEIQTFPILSITEDIIAHQTQPDGSTITSSQLFLNKGIIN